MTTAKDIYSSIYAGIQCNLEFFIMSCIEHCNRRRVLHSFHSLISVIFSVVYNFALIIIITLPLTSCAGKIFSDDSIFAPKPLRMRGPDTKKGSPDYLEGWDDGCKTGLSTMNPGFYKSFYGYKIDPYKVSNIVYYKAWRDAYTYCRQYSFRMVWDSYDRQKSNLENQLCLICPNESER